MSNYTDNNLITTTAPDNARAIKIGNKVFVGFTDPQGVNVSDTTAIASDVLTGKYFYTATGVRTEGTNTGGGATSFYKCASVGSGTWTGYKAVQNSTTKVWSFEESLTTDTLTFDSEKKTPVVNGVYMADATVEAILFYGNDPNTIFLLNVDTLTDKTGNFNVEKDNPSADLSTEAGKYGQNRLVFGSRGSLAITSKGSASVGGSSDYTIECWYTCLNNSYNTTFFPIVGPNQDLTSGSFQFHTGQYGKKVCFWSTGTDSMTWYNGDLGVGSTHHIVLSRRASDNKWKCWLDGNMIQDWDYSNSCSNDAMTSVYIGNGTNSNRYNYAAIQDLRISNCIRYTTDTFTPPTEPLR